MPQTKINPIVGFSLFLNLVFIIVVVIAFTTPWLTPIFYREGFPGICFSLKTNRPMEYEYLSKISTLCGTDNNVSVIFVKTGSTETVYRPGKTYKVNLKAIEYVGGNPTVNLEIEKVEDKALIPVDKNLSQGQVFSHDKEDFEILYISEEKKDFVAIVTRFDQR